MGGWVRGPPRILRERVRRKTAFAPSLWASRFALSREPADASPALRRPPLVLDFLATIVFLVLVALKVDPTIAATVAIAIGVGQVVVLKIMKRPIAPLQWLGLGLVLVFGTASLLTHDMRFLMVKPTVIYVLVGAFMLKRGWMLRYMPPIAAGHGEDVMVAFGYAWAGLMFVSGIVNAIVAVAFTDHWVAFMAIFPWPPNSPCSRSST
uniref:Septation protein IspZ n=1 Tax=Phenylobacterium glaciei TaxID=2803784 RepID=A0A974P590_9CAUL|nr:septation protein IspZ [Phenylobacterium glaciei]